MLYTSLGCVYTRQVASCSPPCFLPPPSIVPSCRAASVVRQLLIHGAELEVVNSNQQTPLDCAHSRVREALHHRRASISHKATSNADTSLPLVSAG